MTTVRSVLLSIMLLGMAVNGAQAEAPDKGESPIEDLGKGQYRIGLITVDKTKRRFTVPGTVAHLEEPLEYIAVTADGYKEYESLLTLNTTATHFQLACLLVGLDDAESHKPRYQFDEQEVSGPAVDIEIGWDVGEKKGSAPAHKTLLIGDKPLGKQDWVFIGSHLGEDGTFMAETMGSLIGFVHDPIAIIEHRSGLGIGAYGGITGNPSLLPPEGAPVTVSVSVIDEKDEEESKQDEEQ